MSTQQQMPIRFFYWPAIGGQPARIEASVSPNVPHGAQEVNLAQAQAYAKQATSNEELDSNYKAARAEHKRRVAADEIPSGNFDSAGFYSGKVIFSSSVVKMTKEELIAGQLPQSGMLAEYKAPWGETLVNVPVSQVKQIELAG